VDPVSAIVGVLVAGATAGLSGVASDAVKAAYAGLWSLIAGHFKDGPPAKAVEDARTSAAAREELGAAIRDAGADKDPAVRQLVEKLTRALEEMGSEKLQSADIKIGAVEAYGNAIATGLEASGNIAIDRIAATTGDVVLGNLRAGDPAPKKA